MGEAYLLILTFLLASAGTLALGLVFKWVDRKVTALVQWRVGPPWYQPMVDVLKLMGKESLMPVTARGTLFLWAPAAALAAAGVAAAVLWSGVAGTGDGFVGDLVVVVYLLMVPGLMTVLGAAASGNPHSAIGAAREIKLLLSYEVPLLLALLVGIAHAAAASGEGWSFRLETLAAAPPAVFSISGVLAMLVAILCVQAKLGQVPFDVAEAECEIMSGVYAEYSGPNLALFLLTRAMMLALLPVLLIMVFWGGLHASAWWGWLTFAGKYVLLVALVTLIRNTNPRLRIDQALRFFWFRLAPIAALALGLALIGISRGISWL
jgi:NADH-quinone oxidoreductase subunit H